MLLFHGDDIPQGKPEESLFHVIPCPYEKSVSYGTGTAYGPQAILEASCQLEVFDCKSKPGDHGIYTAPMVDCSGSHEDALTRVKNAVLETLSYGKLPVVLGGEHTVTNGVVDALIEHYGAAFGVVQFDAHADLRDSYEDSIYSHASVMKRTFDKGIPIFQIGTRSYCEEEHKLRTEHSIPYVDAEAVHRNGVEGIALPDGFPENIFITFDIDGLDSTVMPATGTPVPGGLTWWQVMWIIENLTQSRKCIGFDVVEFAPIEQLHHADFTAAQLVYNIMGYVSRSN